MIIIWGTKVVRKQIGRVADFCFICRDFRPFRGTRIESVGHLYYIPLGARTTLGHNRTCESCGTAFNMHPEAYQSLARDRRADLESLMSETQPRLPEIWKDRVQAEARAREGRLTPDERRSYILEPFILLNYRVEERTSGLHVDRYVVLGLLVTILLPLLALAGLSSAFRPPSEVPTLAAVGGIVVGVGFVIGAAATQTRRYVRRKILPVIVENLRPLAPTDEELDAAVEHLKQMGSPIGKTLKAEDVRDAFGWGGSKAHFPELAS